MESIDEHTSTEHVQELTTTKGNNNYINHTGYPMYNSNNTNTNVATDFDDLHSKPSILSQGKSLKNIIIDLNM